MYLKVKNKKIKIVNLNKYNEKIKSFKFHLKTIDYGIKTKRKFYNTYFFCQRVDICATDKDDKIIKLYENIRSEKFKFILRAKYIYYLPLDTVKYLKIGQTIELKK